MYYYTHIQWNTMVYTTHTGSLFSKASLSDAVMTSSRRYFLATSCQLEGVSFLVGARVVVVLQEDKEKSKKKKGEEEVKEEEVSPIDFSQHVLVRLDEDIGIGVRQALLVRVRVRVRGGDTAGPGEERGGEEGCALHDSNGRENERRWYG
jgi:hypothetical protein